MPQSYPEGFNNRLHHTVHIPQRDYVVTRMAGAPGTGLARDSGAGLIRRRTDLAGAFGRDAGPRRAGQNGAKSAVLFIFLRCGSKFPTNCR
jgi:hypothetical protein